MLSKIQANRCTGSRYPGESLSLSAFPKWHGKFGHFNALILDHDDTCTGRGKHDRVLVTFPDADGLYMRVDHLWGLGMPTEKQMIALARKEINLRGKWKLTRAVEWDSASGKSTDCHFERI